MHFEPDGGAIQPGCGPLNAARGQPALPSAALSLFSEQASLFLRLKLPCHSEKKSLVSARAARAVRVRIRAGRCLGGGPSRGARASIRS